MGGGRRGGRGGDGVDGVGGGGGGDGVGGSGGGDGDGEGGGGGVGGGVLGGGGESGGEGGGGEGSAWGKVEVGVRGEILVGDGGVVDEPLEDGWEEEEGGRDVAEGCGGPTGPPLAAGDEVKGLADVVEGVGIDAGGAAGEAGVAYLRMAATDTWGWAAMGGMVWALSLARGGEGGEGGQGKGGVDGSGEGDEGGGGEVGGQRGSCGGESRRGRRWRGRRR